MSRRPSAAIVVALALALAGCGKRSAGPLSVAIMGGEQAVYTTGVRLPAAAQEVRTATAAGLVALDAHGEVEPALADRWIVTDDGKSYIFRLREGSWPDGADLTGESARDALRGAIRQLRGTSLALDLAPVEDVRAMAARVVEIDLRTPMPDFLRLLAQPELTLSHRGFEAGPMVLQRTAEQKRSGAGELTFRPPEARGLPQEDGWRKYVRPIDLRALEPRAALAAFDEGEVDVVLGGTLATWPLANPGPLSRGNLRVDNTIGLFGLQVENSAGFLAQPANREALAMTIDRDAVIGRFNIGGWSPTTRIVPATAADATAQERWPDSSLEQRRAIATGRVAAWRSGAGKGQPVRLTIALAPEPGFDVLFDELSTQFGRIGVTLVRVGGDKPADLVLVDRVARFARPRWFLDQFNCSLGRGLCSALADQAVADALNLPEGEKAALLARAEAILTAANVYLPIGAPLRWSMVRSNVDGFAANVWAFHPLPEMATIPR